jgi:hypothetical protein
VNWAFQILTDRGFKNSFSKSYPPLFVKNFTVFSVRVHVLCILYNKRKQEKISCKKSTFKFIFFLQNKVCYSKILIFYKEIILQSHVLNYVEDLLHTEGKKAKYFCFNWKFIQWWVFSTFLFSFWANKVEKSTLS